MSEVTQLLHAAQQGDAKAQEELWTIVYHELRTLAARKLAAEREGHTLQPTALVHEVFLRLVGNGEHPPEWQGRAHFFGAAAEAMRRILVDSARRKSRLKHGGGQVAEEFDEALLPAPATEDKLLAVHDALDALAAEDPLKADIVKFKFFVGLQNDEIASLLEVNEKTVRRHWELAKVWLYRALKASKSGEAGTK
jgi:RNA polymerase sigma factor (TIGR02999 family)